MKKKTGIYLHIPFCIKKCAYCDFLSCPADEQTKKKYVNAICKEIETSRYRHEDMIVDSVFIGGGTPTILLAEDIKRILQSVRENFLIENSAEISIEMNPGTADLKKLQTYLEIGINRISIGMQSSKDEELKQLGRVHTNKQFLEAFHMSREAGFTNINVDIMAGLPGQTMKSYEESLQYVIELAPEHISAYGLIIEEGTPFYCLYGDGEEKRSEKVLKLPDEETERKMYYLTKDILEKHGYHRYEISNYAKVNRECRHNLGYWERADYLGFGIGAASLIENMRFKNKNDLATYIEEHYEIEEEQILSRQEQMEEFVFLGLRVMQGCSMKKFKSLFGCSIEEIYGDVIQRFIGEKLLEKEGDRIRLTEKGIDISNYVMAAFLE